MKKQTKSDVIDKGYNRAKKGGMSKKALEAARRAAEEVEIIRFAKEKEGWDKEIIVLTEQIEKLREKLRVLKKKAGYPEEEGPSAKGGNGKEMSTMLRDMWQIYRMSGGMARLKEVMKDAKEFRAMAKEMLKVESMVSTRKKEENQAGQVVYVILKGLQQEADVTVETAPEVRRAIAMTDPSGGEYHD